MNSAIFFCHCSTEFRTFPKYRSTKFVMLFYDRLTKFAIHFCNCLKKLAISLRDLLEIFAISTVIISRSLRLYFSDHSTKFVTSFKTEWWNSLLISILCHVICNFITGPVNDFITEFLNSRYFPRAQWISRFYITIVCWNSPFCSSTIWQNSQLISVLVARHLRSFKTDFLIKSLIFSRHC